METKNVDETEPTEATNKYYDNLESIADYFYDSTLEGHTITYRNGIGIFLARITNGMDDSISEAIAEIHELAKILPYSAEITITGIKFGIKTKSDLPKSIVTDLMDRYVHQGTSFPFGKGINDFYYTTLFMQTVDGDDPTFQEFLKTYPDFLMKKFRKWNK